MPNSRARSDMASPSSRRTTKRRRSSITEHSFQGIFTSRRKAESVTHVSGTFCHLCLGSLTKLEKPNNRTGHLVRRKGPSHRLSRHFALIQLLTRFQGALRLVTLPLYRPHFGSDDLRGVVLT